MRFGGKCKESLCIRKKRSAAPCVLSTGGNAGLADSRRLLYKLLKG